VLHPLLVLPQLPHREPRLLPDLVPHPVLLLPVALLLPLPQELPLLVVLPPQLPQELLPPQDLVLKQ
jgi:hypothetical protein